MSQPFSLLGIKHPRLQHWEQDTSCGSWDSSDHRYIFPWEPRCICHSPCVTNGGQGELSICHAQCGSLHFTVWLQLVQTHALSLPHCRSFAISSVPTSFHNLRPWYRAAKQQKDLISTDVVTIECSQGCWAPLRWSEWGNLAHWVSYKWWIPRLRDLSTVKLLEKGERRQSLFLFRKHWKVFLV